MEEIKIVEYDESYAQGVADMWNKSGDGWGGLNFNLTKDAVIMRKKTADYLVMWLAILGDEVVGLCTLSEYREDTGALYIDCLNVVPEHHGKKIGKALVLKAVEKTTELGWPRLDLYTWPGNTKAVPLYKKCGFFWEKRGDTTHLMNFIPTVLNCDLTKSYFDEIDWYGDATRKIEVEEDGKKENQFDYYTYTWKKNDQNLLMEFCKKGRGLRKIETDKFRITATAENLNLVFGKNYKIWYDIENKTNTPIPVKIVGESDQSIKFNFDEEVVIEKSIKLEGKFYVDEIFTKQQKFKSHPCVVAKFKIDGKTAEFKVGIAPKFPAEIQFSKPEGLCYTGVQSQFYMDIENNYDEDVEFRFDLPETEDIKLLQKKFSIPLKQMGKKSIPIPYMLKKSCVYSPKIEITVHFGDGKIITFSRLIGTVFHTSKGVFYGATQGQYVIGNGKFGLALNNANRLNRAFGMDISNGEGWLNFMPFQLGQPFSSEWHRHKANRATTSQKDGTVILNVYYQSKDFPGIEVKMSFRLHPDGIIERWYRVKNTGKKITENEVLLKDKYYPWHFRAIAPIDGKFIEIRGNREMDIDMWDHEKLHENWVFSRGNEISFGVTWPQKYKANFNDVYIQFEHNLGKLEPRQQVTTKPIVCAVNTYQDWHLFREFALQKRVERASLINSFELVINGGNPFVAPQFPIEVIEHKNKVFEGNLKVSSKFKTFKKFEKKFIPADGIRKVDFQAVLSRTPQVDLIDMNAQFTMEINQKKAIFPIGTNEVVTEKKLLENHEIWSVDNGIIKIKAAPSFMPGIFSCQYNGNEWLESTFPTPQPKSWWNPWTGGLYSFPENLSRQTLLEEDCTANFVEKADNLGNEWKGIQLGFTIQKDEFYKGVTIRQFYLMLPGVPVLNYSVEIQNHSGKFIKFDHLNMSLSANCGGELKDFSAVAINRFGKKNKIHAGKGEIWLDKIILADFSGKNRDESLLVYLGGQNNYTEVTMDNHIAALWAYNEFPCNHGKTHIVLPKFFILSEKNLERDWLTDLQNINF